MIKNYIQIITWKFPISQNFTLFFKMVMIRYFLMYKDNLIQFLAPQNLKEQVLALNQVTNTSSIYTLVFDILRGSVVMNIMEPTEL